MSGHLEEPATSILGHVTMTHQKLLSASTLGFWRKVLSQVEMPFLIEEICLSRSKNETQMTTGSYLTPLADATYPTLSKFCIVGY